MAIKKWFSFKKDSNASKLDSALKKQLQQEQEVADLFYRKMQETLLKQAQKRPVPGPGILNQTLSSGASSAPISITTDSTTAGTYTTTPYWITPNQQLPNQGIPGNQGVPGNAGAWSPTIVIATPYGANQSAIPSPEKQLVIIAVPTFSSSIRESENFKVGDVVLALDTMQCHLRTEDPQVDRWQLVRIKPDGRVEYWTPEVTVKPERKEVFEEFEKHLTRIPEREKNDSSFLQKAKSFFGAAHAPDTPALT